MISATSATATERVSAEPSECTLAPEGGSERQGGEHGASPQGRDGSNPDERQRHVERGEDGKREQSIAQPSPRVHETAIPGIDRGDERARRHQRRENHVRRVEGGRRVIGGEHEEQQVVVERLDRVVGRGEDEALAALEQRRPQLGDQHEEQPEEQQVAHDPAHVRQSAAEDQERGEAQRQREDRDRPAAEPAHDRQPGRGPGVRFDHVAAGTAGAGIPCFRQ